MIKLFVSDMDGTLLNNEHIIAEETAQAIRDLQDAGIEFMIATGRDYPSAQPLLAMHDLSCQIIGVNGAAIYDQEGELLQVNSLAEDLVQDLMTQVQHLQVQAVITTTQQTYVTDYEAYIEDMQVFLQGFSQEPNFDDQMAQFFESVHPISEFFKRPSDEAVLKFLLMHSDPTALAEIAQTLASIDGIDITSSNPMNIEITAQEAQKGLAIQKYLDLRGWDKHQVVTIGDSLNDRSMISDFPKSYAMANAHEQILDLASHQAPANHDLGVARVIREILG